MLFTLDTVPKNVGGCFDSCEPSPPSEVEVDVVVMVDPSTVRVEVASAEGRG